MSNSNIGHPPDKLATSCTQCRHYYITWDENFPYGCRALAFKSKTPPAVTVFSASAMNCQFFTPKKRRPQS